MKTALDGLTLEEVAQRFAQFESPEGSSSSPFYARLARGVAKDRALVELAAKARYKQPIPNMLFAAVQYLLLEDRSHPLATYYPTLTDAPAPAADPCPLFRAYCLEHAAEISALLATRLVQTNEVRRCACLMPAFVELARLHADQPLALIEIGPSAGLNLLWNRYGYDYGDGARCGDPDSPVQLICERRGDRSLPLPATMPEVAFAVGVDVNPIDVRDEDALRWLRALIWPEHRDRVRLLEAAVQIARRFPPRLIAGNALDTLPDLLPTVPANATLCVYHSFTVNQFSREAREQLSALLARHAEQRPLYRISMEGKGDAFAHIEWFTYERGKQTERLLAYADVHGRRLEWRAKRENDGDS
jgi:hypothetical protein